MGLFSIVTKPLGCIVTFVGTLVVLAILLVVGFFWAFEAMAPKIVEQGFTEATGFPTTIHDAGVNFPKQRLSLSGIEIDNPEAFPDREFLKIKEFAVSLDRSQTNQEHITLGELTLDIEELAFLEAAPKGSNLESFFEQAEHSWEQMLEQIHREAAEKNQSVPGDLVISQLHVSLARVKLVNTAGPETVYRALDVNYENTFENVTEIRPVLEHIARDFQSKGLTAVARTIQKAAQ